MTLHDAITIARRALANVGHGENNPVAILEAQEAYEILAQFHQNVESNYFSGRVKLL